MGQTVLGHAIAFGYVDPAQLMPVIEAVAEHPGPRWHPTSSCSCTNATASNVRSRQVPASDLLAELTGPTAESCPQLRRVLPPTVPAADAAALHYVTDTQGLAHAARSGLHVELATLGLWVWGPGAATADPRRSPLLTTDATLRQACEDTRDDLLSVVLSEPSTTAKARILGTYLPAWSTLVKSVKTGWAGRQGTLVRAVMVRAPHLIDLAHAWADGEEIRAAGVSVPESRVHEAWAVHAATTAWRAPVGHAVRVAGVSAYDLHTGAALAPLLSNVSSTGLTEEVLCFDEGFTSAEVARAIEVTAPSDEPFGREAAVRGFITAFRATQL